MYSPKIIILVVFVPFCGVFILGGLVAAICCYMKKMNKEKKRTEHKTEIIHVDDHKRVKEAIVHGPRGPRSVILEIDDDLHVDGTVRKDETVENFREHGRGGGEITSEVVGSSSNQRPNV
ncbi:Protein TRACHEARY ELEMENT DIFFERENTIATION-RELATED 6 [Linum perenne]